MPNNKSYATIRAIYLHAAALTGLALTIIGMFQLANLFFLNVIFPDAGRYRYGRMTSEGKPSITDTARQQRDVANALTFIVIGAPLLALHWRAAQKERTNGNGTPPTSTS